MFNALLSAPKGGTLLAKGQVTQDLSLPTLRKGVNFARVPLDVDVDAHQFDLSFLSGAQLPMVRSIGGVLRNTQLRRVELAWGASIVAEWANWATGIVEQWPEDPGQAEPDRDALRRIAQRGAWSERA